MKVLIYATAVCAAVAAMSAHAQAQNYPWCAYYGTGDGNGTNCGFVTRDQCMATVSGIGGYCDRNTQYVPLGGRR